MIRLVKIFLPLLVFTYAFAMTVQTSVNPETGYIGDPFLYTVSVELEDTYHLTFPRIVDRIGPFMVLSHNTETAFTDSLYKRDFQFQITVFDTGYQVIPSLTLKITDSEKGEEITVFTDSVTVYIESALNRTQTIPEAYEPIPVPVLSVWQKIFLGALIILILPGIYGIVVLKRKKNKSEKIIVHEMNPFEKFNNSISKLRDKSYHIQGNWKAFYLELTAILKEYLETKYFIHISDLPVSELIPVLRSELGNRWPDEMSEMLRFADLVKFALTPSTTEHCENDLKTVLNWCVDTEKYEINENMNRQIEKSS